MEIKKFVTYEFNVTLNYKETVDNLGGEEQVGVLYKVNEDDSSRSLISFLIDGKMVSFPANLILEVAKVMREVNPFEFALDGE